MTQRDEMQISAEFLQVAACPQCHHSFAIDYDSHELVCTSPQCGLAFPVRDGIPVLLIDEARSTHSTDAEQSSGRA